MAFHSAAGANVQVTLDSLNEVLGNNEQFGLVWIGDRSFVCTSQTYIAHLRDKAQRTLLIITLLPGHRRADTVLQMADTSGQTILTASGTSLGSMRVFSCGQFLGTLGSSCYGFVALGPMNELLFQVDSGICCGPSDNLCCFSCAKEFSINANGVRLASLRKSNDQSVEAEVLLSNTRNVDSRTVALLIFAVITLYIAEFAETSCCGRVGVRGVLKRFLWVFITFILCGLCLIYFLFF